MTRRRAMFSTATYAALYIAVAACLQSCRAEPARAEDRVHRLRYGSPYSPLHPFSRADLRWMQYVEGVSQGRLRIEPFWSGALLSAEQGMLELRHGVADIGLITPIYARGGGQAIRTQAGFYAGAYSARTQVSVYRCLADEFPILQREVAGLHVLAVQGGNLPALLTRDRPVHRLRDLAGLRVRVPAELSSVLQALGADPVSMPMGEVYSALAKGVIDGVVAPADTLRSLHFADVVHYLTDLAIPRGAYPARAIATAALVSLPEDLQAVLLDSRPFWERAIDEQLGVALDLGKREAQQRGIRVLPIDPAEQRRFESIYTSAAIASAKQLTHFGADGLAMLERAQQLIHQPGNLTAVACKQAR